MGSLSDVPNLSGFSQCGAPGVLVAAAAGLERREYEIRPAVPPQAPEAAALFGGWRPEGTDANARGGWSGIK